MYLAAWVICRLVHIVAACCGSALQLFADVCEVLLNFRVEFLGFEILGQTVFAQATPNPEKQSRPGRRLHTLGVFFLDSSRFAHVLGLCLVDARRSIFGVRPPMQGSSGSVPPLHFSCYTGR